LQIDAVHAAPPATDHPHEYRHEDSGSLAANPSQRSDLNTLEERRFYNVPPSMDSEEVSYLLRTILSFKHYRRHAFAMNHVRMQNFYALPAAQRALLQPQFTEKLQAIDEAIEKNALIAKRIARLGEEMYLGGSEVPPRGPLTPRQKYSLYTFDAKYRDMEKARSTLKQFVRDWSAEVSYYLTLLTNRGLENGSCVMDLF
jgi:hypothetical protein